MTDAEGVRWEGETEASPEVATATAPAGQDPKYSDATRYLCIGGELDEPFALNVIKELFVQPSRMVAHSYGIDVVPIAKHCLKARRRRGFRDLLLLLLLAVELVVFPVLTLILAGIIFLGRSARRQSSMGGRAAIVLLLLAAFAAAFWAVSGQAAPFGGSSVSWIGLDRIGFFLVSLVALPVAAVAVCFAEWLMARTLVGARLNPHTFDPDEVTVPLPMWARHRLGVVQEQQYGNVTTFHMEKSQGDVPFIGSGSIGRRWSFVLNVSRPGAGPLGERTEPAPFSALELHHFVEERVRHAGIRATSPGLEISDQVFVAGWYRRPDQPAQPPFPDARMTQGEMERIIDGPAGSPRHFRCLRIEWQGHEQIASAFLHLAKEGSTLYVEFIPCLQSPIRGWYKDFDAFPYASFREMADHLGRIIRSLPSLLIGSPERLIRSYWQLYLDRLLIERKERRARVGAWIMDYGAWTSVRELGSNAEPKNALQLFDPDKYVIHPRRYMQLLDAEKYTKALEVHVLDAIRDFLEGRGVDTRELSARRTAILDTSTFVAQTQGNVVSLGQQQEQ